MPAATALTVTLEQTKETKNTVVFSTEDRDAPINQVYVEKAAVAALGNPRSITLTIEAS